MSTFYFDCEKSMLKHFNGFRDFSHYKNDRTNMIDFNQGVHLAMLNLSVE